MSAPFDVGTCDRCGIAAALDDEGRCPDCAQADARVETEMARDDVIAALQRAASIMADLPTDWDHMTANELSARADDLRARQTPSSVTDNTAAWLDNLGESQ